MPSVSGDNLHLVSQKQTKPEGNTCPTSVRSVMRREYKSKTETTDLIFFSILKSG